VDGGLGQGGSDGGGQPRHLRQAGAPSPGVVVPRDGKDLQRRSPRAIQEATLFLPTPVLFLAAAEASRPIKVGVSAAAAPRNGSGCDGGGDGALHYSCRPKPMVRNRDVRRRPQLPSATARRRRAHTSTPAVVPQIQAVTQFLVRARAEKRPLSRPTPPFTADRKPPTELFPQT